MTFWDLFVYYWHQIWQFIWDIPMYIVGAIMATFMWLGGG